MSIKLGRPSLAPRAPSTTPSTLPVCDERVVSGRAPSRKKRLYRGVQLGALIHPDVKRDWEVWCAQHGVSMSLATEEALVAAMKDETSNLLKDGKS